MSDYHCKTAEAAKGQWRGILLELGVPSQFLTNRHGPCPLCKGGRDRFRFDNKEGKGTFICNTCGAGDGMKFAMTFTGEDFLTTARRIDEILGNKKFDPDRLPTDMSEEQRKAKLREVAAKCQIITPNSVVDRYLAKRGIDDTQYPKALRYVPDLWDGEGGVRPCMVAIVQAPDGSNATLHRTFLRPDGSGKADMLSARKMMPGSIPDGSAVRLSDWVPGPIGIAEGIETALAASRLYELPVWAALNASMLEKWQPPEGVQDITIFGDNDPAFGGQSAAYRLAHRLSAREKHDVVVKIPDQEGWDWNDVLLSKLKSVQIMEAAA